MKLKKIIENQLMNALLCVILTAFIYYVDWITGIDFNIYAFYVFPLFILSLNNKNKLFHLFLSAFIIGILWVIEDYHFKLRLNNGHYSYFLLIWNGAIRMLFYGLVAFAFSVIKSQREKLNNAIGEKEILLKEVYHRVKNNMQVISSLLALEMNRTKDQEIIHVLKKSISRIHSMSIVHEKLYKSSNLAHISVREYLDGLITFLIENYKSETTEIQFTMDIPDGLTLEMDRMIPFGLILNELTTNSIKHAFTGRKEGLITISIVSHDNLYYLHFSDNGTGINKPISADDPGTLGLSIIKSLAGQLDGNFEINNKKGTEFVVSFKANNSKASLRINR